MNNILKTYNNMNKFNQASEEERKIMTQLFKKYNVTNYIFTPSTSYDREDGYYTGKTNNQPYIFEIKNRDIPSDKYPTTIIEKDKIKYLQAEAIKRNKNEKIIIFFIFNDQKWFSQEIKYDDFFWSTNYKCPSTTMRDSEMIYKECYSFKINNLKTLN